MTAMTALHTPLSAWHRALAPVVGLGLAWAAGAAAAQTPASVSYSPNWLARHQLQLLVDHAGLALTTSHWPLPVSAVSQALQALPDPLPEHMGIDLQAAKQALWRDVTQSSQQSAAQLQLRQRAEGLTGFGEDHTPGSSAQWVSAQHSHRVGEVSMAARLGLRLAQDGNSVRPVGAADVGGVGALQWQGTAAALGWQGWQVQAFSQRHWWGPAWQSSLVNGANQPAWQGVGVQRSSGAPSASPWLSWMGPWSFDVFAARAQDPLHFAGQPQGFVFSGMRMTLQPKPWLELGLSRGLQAGGTGRPSGARNFVLAFLGQQVNQNPGDPPDTSGQIAGYDARVRCPKAWGGCAVYTQWMGEDAAGKIPLPTKFMSLWGAEHSFGAGRYRVFAERTNTFANSLPWSRDPQFPGYINVFYQQGYTHGARWAGAAQGAASRVTTLGLMDAQAQRQVKLHLGRIGASVGAYDVRAGQAAPHGRLTGLSLSQTVRSGALTWTPELSWLSLSEGQSSGVNQRRMLRLGTTLAFEL